MRLGEVRHSISKDTTIWLQNEFDGSCLGADINDYLSNEYDGREVLIMYPERYASMATFGITIILE